MSLRPGMNGTALSVLREQGLDANGQPISSYWKARIEAEEGRVRVRELEAELEALRSRSLLVADLPPPVSEDATIPRLQELTKALEEAERAKRILSGSFQTRIRDLQESQQGLRKEIQNLQRSRDLWKNKAQGFEKVIRDLRHTPTQEESRDITPLGHHPSLRELLLWVGVRLRDGRVLAVGEDSSSHISIEVQGDELVRVTEPDKGIRRIYKRIPLSAPVPELLSIFVPYKGYYEYRTDAYVQEVFRMLGRPLTLL